MAQRDDDPKDLDLGLGSVVTQRSRQRFLNRDGSFNVLRRGLPFLEALSPYHDLLTTSWFRFYALLVGSYLAVNALFAVVFVMFGDAALKSDPDLGLESRFARAFFFSVETFSTIGFGNITPLGLAPHVLMTVEALVGLLWVAIATGLLFARFSRPTARILFSTTAVVAPYRGGRGLMFRIANARSNQLIDLQARVMLGRLVSQDGRKVRKFDDLSLERTSVAFFPLSWTVVHPIDGTSPLHGVDEAAFRAADSEILILLSGVDETFSQTVHARTSFKPDEVAWNARFVGIFDSPKEGEPLSIDLHRLSEIEPV